MIHSDEVLEETMELLLTADAKLPGWVVFQTDTALQLRKAAYWLTKSDESPLPPEHRKNLAFEWYCQGKGWVTRLDLATDIPDDDGTEWVTGRVRMRKPHKRSSND